MTSVLQDLRYSLRTLRKSPGFVISGVLALAFGIGFHSMVFSVLNAVTLRPLPVVNADEIITVYQAIEGTPRRVHGTRSLFSLAEYEAYRDRNQTLSGIVAYTEEDLTLNRDEALRVVGQLATCNYFRVLTPTMAMGRGFLDEECISRGASPVAVLSHHLWEQQFESNPGILGQAIRLNGNPHTIVGIAPKGFRGASLETADLWAPIAVQEQWMPGQKFLDDANLSWLYVAGRIKPGISLPEVRADLAVIASQIDQQNSGRTTRLDVERATLLNSPMHRRMVLSIGAMTLAAVSLVLLIACANLANLLLARGIAREKEIALRLAIGSSRLRLIRQLLTENLLVALAGGGLGVLLAWRLLESVFPFVLAQMPDADWQSVALNFTPDVRVLAYSLLLCMLTAIGFGLLPAWQASNLDLNTALKGGARQRTGKWFRGLLVAVQIAVCMVLLIGTGLLARGVHASQAIDPGLRMEDVSVATLDLTRQGYDEPRATEFHRRLSERLTARFGAAQVALVDPVPLAGGRRQNSVRVEGLVESIDVAFGSVSPGYFDLAGIPIVSGSSFAQAVGRSDSPVAIISESTARRLWPNQNAVGKRFEFEGAAQFFTVIGIARDVRTLDLAEIDKTFVYFAGAPSFYRNARLLVRGSAEHAETVKAIRDEVANLDASLLVQTARWEDNLIEFRLPSQITGVFGFILGVAGLLLASLGVYAVVAHAVAHRGREIGIRMALGAERGTVVRMILMQGMRPVVIGVVFGVAGAAAVSRLLGSLLFGISPMDPLVYTAVCIFLGGIACAAGYGPARRASRNDPMAALRKD
jgi:predicted permease